MPLPDLNLLFTLDALLAEASVARAARRLGLSPSAMSRSLARLRRMTGDPLLVRAGRDLVPTPRARDLRERVARLVDEAQAALRPLEQLDLASLSRTFTLRVSDGFVENFGPALIARASAQAPGVRLRFIQKADKESTQLRNGSVDLETGVVDGAASPEVRTRRLFDDHFVGAVRSDHPLAQGEITAARYASPGHVLVARQREESGRVDTYLAQLGLARKVGAIAGGFGAALALAAASDLVATVPRRHTGKLRDAMFSFAVPLPLPTVTVALMWHPRMEADAAHRWLRNCVFDSCAA